MTNWWKPKYDTPLSALELSVVAGALLGLRNKAIARRINNTEQVVKNALRHAYIKLGVRGRYDLAIKAAGDGGYRLLLYGEPDAAIDEPYPQLEKYESAAEKRAAILKARRDNNSRKDEAVRAQGARLHSDTPRARHALQLPGWRSQKFKDVCSGRKNDSAA